MPFTSLLDMTWEEARELPAARTIAVLPIGAVEAHGPHLPLGTDGIIADAMARAGAERLAQRGWHAVLLPRLDYTPARFAAAFPGTISLNADGHRDAIVEIVTSLAANGLAVTVIANAHFDPQNVAAIGAAAGALPPSGVRGRIVFPDVTRKPWALRLTDEFRSGACHAGRYEGSIVMAERPELVRTEIQAALPDNPRSLSDAIREGKTTFAEAGGDRAYFGSPACASADEGRQTVAVLGEILADAVREQLGDPGKPRSRER